MRQLFRGFCLVCVFVSGLVVASLAAELPGQEKEWQSAISGQIEAFRRGDAQTALDYAGMSFKVRYANASAFYADIKRSGYAPIMDSRSHSFGPYELTDEALVFQIVELTGPKSGLYRAMYQLSQEEDGWRVQSVVLRKKPGIGI